MIHNEHCLILSFYRKKLPDNGDWNAASNYVAKKYVSPVDISVYLDDVRLQMEAKLWAEAFNRQNPPKKVILSFSCCAYISMQVDVFQMSLIEIIPESPDSPPPLNDSKRRGSITMLSAPLIERKAKFSQFYHIERYMDGEYRKYNSNSGFVDDQPRNTPQVSPQFIIASNVITLSLTLSGTNLLWLKYIVRMN